MLSLKHSYGNLAQRLRLIFMSVLKKNESLNLSLFVFGVRKVFYRPFQNKGIETSSFIALEIILMHFIDRIPFNFSCMDKAILAFSFSVYNEIKIHAA